MSDQNSNRPCATVLSCGVSTYNVVSFCIIGSTLMTATGGLDSSDAYSMGVFSLVGIAINLCRGVMNIPSFLSSPDAADGRMRSSIDDRSARAPLLARFEHDPESPSTQAASTASFFAPLAPTNGEVPAEHQPLTTSAKPN